MDREIQDKYSRNQSISGVPQKLEEVKKGSSLALSLGAWFAAMNHLSNSDTMFSAQTTHPMLGLSPPTHVKLCTLLLGSMLVGLLLGLATRRQATERWEWEELT